MFCRRMIRFSYCHHHLKCNESTSVSCFWRWSDSSGIGFDNKARIGCNDLKTRRATA
jgi:hypothetical protein